MFSVFFCAHKCIKYSLGSCFNLIKTIISSQICPYHIPCQRTLKEKAALQELLIGISTMFLDQSNVQ